MQLRFDIGKDTTHASARVHHYQRSTGPAWSAVWLRFGTNVAEEAPVNGGRQVPQGGQAVVIEADTKDADRLRGLAAALLSIADELEKVRNDASDAWLQGQLLEDFGQVVVWKSGAELEVEQASAQLAAEVEAAGGDHHG